ncbi:hypothetical protein Slala05_73490 [Streptomyces lavendulae subsp. lavendulae]|nr:hypothetical protein Slala05_73490 [Streptomyces lavendulae subsp. lavendulae]
MGFSIRLPDRLQGTKGVRVYVHQSATRRVFVVGHQDRDSATADMFRLAAVLRRAGLVTRYGVSTRRIVGNRGNDGWGVYLTDRAPDQAPPVHLSFESMAA